MKWLLLIFISVKTFSQDSVSLKVTWSKKIKDSVYYVFKIIETGESVRSVCCCEQRKKGTIIRKANKDLEFIKSEL